MTSRTIPLTVAGLVAGAGLTFALAGPAAADTSTPVPTTPLSPASSSATPALPTVAPSAPSGPIEVPAGNAGTGSSGGDSTAITLLSAGGVLVAGAGVVAVRRRA